MSSEQPGAPVYRYWLNLPVGVDRRNIPELLRNVAAQLEEDRLQGYEMVGLTFSREYQNVEPDDEDLDLPTLCVYVAKMSGN